MQRFCCMLSELRELRGQKNLCICLPAVCFTALLSARQQLVELQGPGKSLRVPARNRLMDDLMLEALQQLSSSHQAIQVVNIGCGMVSGALFRTGHGHCHRHVVCAGQHLNCWTPQRLCTPPCCQMCTVRSAAWYNATRQSCVIAATAAAAAASGQQALEAAHAAKCDMV